MNTKSPSQNVSFVGKFRKIILLITILGLSVLVSILLREKPNIKPETKNLPSAETMNTEITASFEIYTNGTKRIFTDTKYHNLSPDVYIQNPNPVVINVKKTGVTWDDFFKTLPMKLTSECLTTGTGQLFCTGENGKLSFFINDKEEPKALEMIIEQGDRLLIRYNK